MQGRLVRRPCVCLLPPGARCRHSPVCSMYLLRFLMFVRRDNRLLLRKLACNRHCEPPSGGAGDWGEESMATHTVGEGVKIRTTPSLSPPNFGGEVPPPKIGGGQVGVDRIAPDSLDGCKRAFLGAKRGNLAVRTRRPGPSILRQAQDRQAQEPGLRLRSPRRSPSQTPGCSS